MSTEYEWTDWITHIPGQELLAGMYVRCEFLGYTRNGGKPYTREGLVDQKHRGHGVWYERNPYGKYVMLLRYKIRIESDEQEVPQEVTNPVKIVESA